MTFVIFFFENLAKTPKERQKKYKDMVEAIIKADWHAPKKSKTNSFRKKNYSTVYFIGDPHWVKKKYDKIKKFIQGRQEKFKTTALN